MPNGQCLQFRVEKVPGDGDCGFHVIGIPRKEAADALIEHLDDEVIRGMIGSEIRSMLMDGMLPDAVLDDTIREVLKKRTELEGQIHKLSEAKKSPRALQEQLEALEVAVVMPWCSLKGSCERFVYSYIRDSQKDGYLQTAVRHGGEAHTTLDALARIYKFQAAIWQPDEEEVTFVGWVNKDADGELVHMLHDGHVHFDLLRVVLGG